MSQVWSSGMISTVAGTMGTSGYTGDGASATAARLSNPTGVALSSWGDLYIADRDNYVIRKVISVPRTLLPHVPLLCPAHRSCSPLFHGVMTL